MSEKTDVMITPQRRRPTGAPRQLPHPVSVTTRAWLVLAVVVLASLSQRAPSVKSALMNHTQAIPDASESAASASPVVMYQSSAARRLPAFATRRSRHIGPVGPRRPW
jgi:hypothetical protein